MFTGNDISTNGGTFGMGSFGAVRISNTAIQDKDHNLISLASVPILKLNTIQALSRKCVALVLIYNWKKQFNIYNKEIFIQKSFKNAYLPIYSFK
jgi:hypothetical protein